MQTSHTLILDYTALKRRFEADFQSLFIIIEAAGGCVFNQKGQLLVIYRRNSWDLPKGKIDKGETPDIAAIREVQEERAEK